MTSIAGSTQGINNPFGLAIDNNNNYIYIANHQDSTISKISLSYPTEIYTPKWVNLTDVADYGLTDLCYITIDNSSTYLYALNGNQNYITRININNPLEIIVKWISNSTSSVDIYSPAILVIDSSDNYMYVSNSFTPKPGSPPYNSISRITISDTPTIKTWLTINLTTNNNANTIFGIAIDNENKYMYVGNNLTMYIMQVTISTASINEEQFLNTNFVGVANGGYPWALAIDKYNNLYGCYQDQGYRIFKTPISDTTKVEASWGTSSEGVDHTIYLTIDNSSTYMYFCNNFTNDLYRITLSDMVCFKENSKILTDKGYISIQDLQKGDLVKTLKHGYRAIDIIGKRKIFHQASEEHIKDQLYKCSKETFAEVFEDLIITGCHSILVNDFISQEQEDKTREIFGEIYFTDGLIRLPACVDERTVIYEKPGTYTIYHFALENENNAYNYGIYANGLLVETCSSYYLKNLSNMKLIE